ncbi:OmpA family protein [Prevotella copri]|uniref:OmpA family protein n=1 Tax=Segatella copri TaxID=165179 RepID=A0AAW5IWN7_9BACT|nr:OmpA family protein [Segatella copri]MCP9552879.1 OmpA family protein [Segatella copri]MCP9573597.1 OmpA family protein [Segatella copri]MCP9576726.1 OmpA family protein [Segatella copri]MCP9579561.1 OmpA family protein [Segatella copri]MCP9582494.1 OmpA family protein [Segatella copri]
MNTMKSLFAASLLTLGTTAAMAQATYTDKEGNEYTFNKHFFLDLQGGAQYTLGEAKFGDLLSPNVQLGLGYQFSPVFGMRLQANGWQSKGGWAGFRAQKGETPYNANYKFKYVAPGVDFMFNLSNLFCGWNPNRVLNVTAFAGAGANIAWDNDEVNELAATMKNMNAYNLEYLWDGTKVRPYGRAGLELAFKVSKSVSLMLEGNANIISDKYNSKKAGNPDWYFNALAGVRINLGKSYTKKAKPVEEPAPAPAPKQEYVAPKPEPKPAPVEKKVEEIRRDIFFTINSCKIAPAEDAKIREVVDFLNKNTEAKVVVTGYADKGTGNDVINDRIAAKRAAAVVGMLTKIYNIPSERITEASKGARVQPFAENAKNRVTIMIAK